MSNEGIDMMNAQLKGRGELNWVEFDKKYKDRQLGLSDAPIQLYGILKVLVTTQSPEKRTHINEVLRKLNETLDALPFTDQELGDISTYAENLVLTINSGNHNVTDETQKDSIRDLYNKVVELKRKKSQLQPA